MVALTSRNRRRLLTLACIVLALGTAATAALGVLVPLDAARPPHDAGPQAAPADARPGPKVEPLAAYAAIAQRDLNRPLFDAPPPPPPRVVYTPPPVPVLAAHLVGTAVEPGFTYAIFQNAAGQQKLVSIGESIDGATVTAVADGSATVTFNGQSLVLKVEKAAPSASPMAPGPGTAALMRRRLVQPPTVQPKAEPASTPEPEPAQKAEETPPPEQPKEEPAEAAP